MSNIISVEQYYLAFAHFIIACQAQAEVRKHEKELEKILKNENVGDNIYNPAVIVSKEVFDGILIASGIQVDWLSLEKKDKKKKDRQTELTTDEGEK